MQQDSNHGRKHMQRPYRKTITSQYLATKRQGGVGAEDQHIREGLGGGCSSPHLHLGGSGGVGRSPQYNSRPRSFMISLWETKKLGLAAPRYQFQKMTTRAIINNPHAPCC